MTRVGLVGAMLSALVALTLTGCTAPSNDPAPALRVAPELIAQREASRIPDCPETPAEATPTTGGLPDLLLGCLGSGRQVNMAALRGTPMVINVWAQWCAPCRVEAPHLAEFAERAGDEVRVLGIDYDDPDPALALTFAHEAGWAYPHLVDPLKKTAGPLRFQGIPLTLFVDGDGRITHRIVGGITSTQQLIDETRTHLGVIL